MTTETTHCGNCYLHISSAEHALGTIEHPRPIAVHTASEMLAASEMVANDAAENGIGFAEIEVADSIWIAMMKANGPETTAPQNGVYGMLAGALKATLTIITEGDTEYADGIYRACIRNGEAPSSIIHDHINN